MRIHTDKVNEVRYAIWQATGALPGVYAVLDWHGSRSRKGALELKMTGNAGRYRNSGKWGSDGEEAATWDEWGIVLAAVFAADPDAICGSAKRPVYAGADDFHWQTGERFAHVGVALKTENLGPLLPEDTHALHRWNYETFGTIKCGKCTAVRYAPIRG